MSTQLVYILMFISVLRVFKASSQSIPKSREYKMQDSTAMIEFLSKHYDRHTPPVNQSKPVQVSLQLIVESFDGIEETSMEFSLYIYIIQTWIDPRLKNVVNASTVVTGKDIELVWKPDTYCLNARQSDLMMPDDQSHSMFRLQKNGRVVYSRGSYLKTSCLMDLRDFPMDDQKCSINLASYGYSKQFVVYNWEGQVTVPSTSRELAQFNFVNSMISTLDSCYYSGNFTVLMVTFQFQRRLGYYLLQIYIPCSFLVMLSWIAFWMDKCDTGNRLTVGVTTILTIMFLLGHSNFTVPKMSYVKAMDVYLLSSFAFIFFSLVETVMCWRFDSEQVELKEKKKDHPNHSLAVHDHERPLANGGSEQRIDVKRVDKCGAKSLSNSEIDEVLLQKIGRCLDRLQTSNGLVPTERNSEVPKRVKRPRVQLDSLARVVFPLAYVLFNIIYWSVLTTHS